MKDHVVDISFETPYLTKLVLESWVKKLSVNQIAGFFIVQISL